MENNLYVSPSPHIHGGDSISKNMYGVLIALIPAFLVSLYFFGLGALIVTVVSVLACMIFEYLIQRFLMKKEPTLCDGSAILTGVLLAFNLPSNLPVWIIIIGALAAIGIGKMSFGGLGNNIFNPALVGRVFLLISFPAQMTTWPVVDALNVFPMTYTDAQTGATVLSLMNEGVTELPSYGNMLVGAMGGSLGEVSAVALILGLLFMLWKKIITWQIPVSILATVFVFTGIMHLVNPVQYASPVRSLIIRRFVIRLHLYGDRLRNLADEQERNACLRRGNRNPYHGDPFVRVLPEGMSFAILIMNAFTPLINSYIKPKHFGGK